MSRPCRILAIETSGRAGSAAIGDERDVIAAARLTGQMQHAAQLHVEIDRLLREQGWRGDSITDVYVSIGPGSFTGLRIGITVARTLAWSIGARIVACPTVDVLARNALDAEACPQHLAVALDAKRKQIYTAAFEIRDGRLVKTTDAQLADPAAFLQSLPKPLHVLGEGIDYHREAIDASGAEILDKSLWPGRAENVYAVGRELAEQNRFIEGGDLVPLYIRRPEAEEKWEKLHPEQKVQGGDT